MLDIKFIRENPELVNAAARKKHLQFNVEELIKLDDTRRAKISEVEAMRAEANAVADAVPKITNEADRQRAIEGMRAFKIKLGEKEKEQAIIDEKYRTLMFEVPNIPDPSVPEGASDAENQEIRQWGTKPEFSFEPKDHITILKDLDLADFERGTRVAGFRGYVLKREAVLLSVALWQFAMDYLSKKGFTPLIVPSLAREENFYGTGYFPQGKEDIFRTQDDLALVGTGEVSTMGMFAGEMLRIEDLPMKFVALSPCYRREIGAHGKDTKGLYRVHEFMKVEQVVLCRADHVESVRLHEEITANAEEIMQALGIAYRVVANCGGDLGQGQVKKYDIEAWLPSQNKFGETHSASYFHDFQTRRLNIRYKDNEGAIRFAHSLNSTAIPTPRSLIALLEQNQRSDGSINIPEPLRPFMGLNEIRR
ncbi:MAG: serine--tRNA ligase [Patescibacteria group bacterium]